VSKKQTETIGVDILWNDWLDGIKKVNELQNEYEAESLNVLNNLEELLIPTNEVLKKAEKEIFNFTKEMNANLKDSVNEVAKGSESSNVYWFNQVEAVSNHTHRLFWNSHKTLSDVVLKSQKQLSTKTEDVLKERQKVRSEIVKTIEELIGKIKETQKAFVPTR